MAKFKKLVLKPRFLEIKIPEEYDTIQLDQLMELIRGISYSSQEINSEKIGNILINLNCFQKLGGFVDKGIIYFTGKTNKCSIATNEILISITDVTRDGNVIGFPLIIPNFHNIKKVFHSMDTAHCKINTKLIYKKFLFYLFSSEFFHKSSFSFSAGTTVLHLDLNSVKKIILPIPNITEQQKIASILSNVDALIESTQGIIEKTERLKKGLMQQLLTKGIKNSLIKFSRLDSIIFLQRGHDLPKHERKIGKIPVIGSNGVVGYHNKYKSNGPGVIIGRSGTLGKTYYVVENYWPLNTSLYVKEFRSSFPKFVFYLLQNLNYEKFNSGTSVPTLNRNHLHSFKIKVPKNIKEQQKIASILSGVDAYIQKNQVYKEKLERLKKGLMQNLLTGKIRVKT